MSKMSVIFIIIINNIINTSVLIMNSNHCNINTIDIESFRHGTYFLLLVGSTSVYFGVGVSIMIRSSRMSIILPNSIPIINIINIVIIPVIIIIIMRKISLRDDDISRCTWYGIIKIQFVVMERVSYHQWWQSYYYYYLKSMVLFVVMDVSVSVGIAVVVEMTVFAVADVAGTVSLFC